MKTEKCTSHTSCVCGPNNGNMMYMYIYVYNALLVIACMASVPALSTVCNITYTIHILILSSDMIL